MKPIRLPVTAWLSTLLSTLPVALLSAFPAGAAQAQQADDGVTIGVMTDMSGVLSDLSGSGSLLPTAPAACCLRCRWMTASS